MTAGRAVPEVAHPKAAHPLGPALLAEDRGISPRRDRPEVPVPAAMAVLVKAGPTPAALAEEMALARAPAPVVPGKAAELAERLGLAAVPKGPARPATASSGSRRSSSPRPSCATR